MSARLLSAKIIELDDILPFHSIVHSESADNVTGSEISNHFLPFDVATLSIPSAVTVTLLPVYVKLLA